MSLSIPDLDFKGRRFLLVGGAGFIGHNLALRLHQHGAEVAILDSLQVNNVLSLHDSQSAPQERLLYEIMLQQRLNLIQSADIAMFVEDARDYHRFGKRFQDFQPDTVIVLAAVSHASRANKDPKSTLDHSYRSLENALDNSRGRVEHFIFMSSSMVYGNFQAETIDETAPCEPLGIYGAVKLGNEKLVAAYGNVFDLPYTIIRPSALYGQRCISRRVGQIFIENAIRGRDLIIQGSGEDRIDFTYIDDFTQGILRSAWTEDAKGEIFNITYGSARTLNEVAELVSKEFPGTSIKHTERQALVPERGTLDVSKARDLIGYAPEYPVSRGFLEYMLWYRELFENFDSSVLLGVNAQSNE